MVNNKKTFKLATVFLMVNVDGDYFNDHWFHDDDHEVRKSSVQ